jgi:hypothetical protein
MSQSMKNLKEQYASSNHPPSYSVSLLQDMPVDEHLYSFEGMGSQK